LDSEDVLELTDNSQCSDKDVNVRRIMKNHNYECNDGNGTNLASDSTSMSMNASYINRNDTTFYTKVKEKNRKRKACEKDLERIHCDAIFNSPIQYHIGDKYCSPDPDIITGQLWAVTDYILRQNIPINRVNAFYTKNFEPNTEDRIEMRDYLVQKYQVIFDHFTEEEDQKILNRLNLLINMGLITDLKGFVEQLNELNRLDVKRTHKSVRNIVGLYVGQDLQRRLAYSICQRLVFLRLGFNMKNTHRLKKQESEGTPKLKGKIKFWSLDEDKLLVEMVLQNRSGTGIMPVEKCVEQEVDWDKIVEKFEEYGRTKRLLRERWNRKLKVMLLENEEDPEAVFEYRINLLEHVAGLGVKDKKEIIWKDVAKTYTHKTSSALNQDFLSLLRRHSHKGENLEDQILDAIHSLQYPNLKSKAASFSRVIKMSERKSELQDFYKCLLQM